MNKIGQFFLICGFWQAGERLSPLLPIKIPGSILGMLLLYGLLLSGTVKLKHVEDCSNAFLKHLAFFFVPPSIALIATWDLLKTHGLHLIAIIVISTLLIMAITAKLLDLMIGESA